MIANTEELLKKEKEDRGLINRWKIPKKGKRILDDWQAQISHILRELDEIQLVRYKRKTNYLETFEKRYKIKTTETLHKDSTYQRVRDIAPFLKKIRAEFPQQAKVSIF